MTIYGITSPATTARKPCSWHPGIATSCCLTGRKGSVSRPSLSMIESLKLKDKSFTIQTHGYSHETRPVFDCTRVLVSRTRSSFSLECLKVQKVHNVLNLLIGTPRTVCACAQPALGRSTAKLIKTGLLMTYPTIHTII